MSRSSGTRRVEIASAPNLVSTTLIRGPVGDPASKDPFERAQAQAPEGWHVEGQIIGMRMKAWGPTPCLCRGTGKGCNTSSTSVYATGRDHLEMADNLVAEMALATRPLE